MKASDKKIKREEPLSVELMIATVSQNDDSVLDRMHVQSDAVVINQGSPFQWQEFRQDDHLIRFLCCEELGIGLSRNTALMRARGDICLFADDDLVYRDGYVEKIGRAFQEHPDADVIVFNIQSIGARKCRYQIPKPKRIHWYNFERYGAARIAVRRTSIFQHHISFSLLFGGGAQYPCGEDTLFLRDCLKAGLKIYAVPITLADVDDSTSSWFSGYDEKFLMGRGALYRAMYPRLALFWSFIYLLRHKKVWQESSFIGALRSMRRGIRDYTTHGGEYVKEERVSCGSIS